MSDRHLHRFKRPGPLGPAILAGLVLALSACAGPVPEPEPVVTATPAASETPRPKPRRIAHAKRPEAICAATKADLPQNRKEALFRAFDATVAADPTAGLTTIQSPAHGPATDCRQASR